MSTIIKHREFSNYKTYSMDLAGRPLTLEVGKLAELANASVLVRYGDTVVLVCATASAKPRDGIDFFPLSVDFEEKMYSVGRIPGSFLRREGRPGEKGVLTSQMCIRDSLTTAQSRPEISTWKSIRRKRSMCLIPIRPRLGRARCSSSCSSCAVPDCLLSR